tara:strand:+ start:9197 stop:9991 length:795 start_codon:yes stop_codon:yes gene_type:complete
MSIERKYDENGHKYSFKIILIGDSNTGKTTICNTLLDRENLKMQYQPTIGIDLNILRTNIYDNILIKSQIWDTAGQEAYRSIINSYYRNTCGTILTYSITNMRSFNNLQRWINDINQLNNCRHNYTHPILLLGTCKDLEQKRKVTYKQGLEFASKHHNIIFREVVSFEKKGALEEGVLEFLRLIYLLTEKSRKEELEKIPIAIPLEKNINRYLNITASEQNTEICVLCKGVKFNKNTFELETINLKKEEDSRDDNVNKYCGKCI